jgi:thioredoxin reductase (NADPH)
MQETVSLSDARAAAADRPFEIAVIGGGPAGLSAALYAARARRRTVIFEQGALGGQIGLTHAVENYPGAAEGVNGFDLADVMRQQAERHGAELRYTAATAIAPVEGGFRIATASGELLSRALIVATGAEYRRLGVPGEEALTGRGVSYCATCDAAFFRDVEVAVVGGGDAALDEALFITRFAAKVHLIHRRDTLRASRVLQERAFANPKIAFVWNTVVEAIEGNDEVEALQLLNTVSGEQSRLAVSGIFIFIGQVPSSGLLGGLAPADEGGHLLVDLQMQTPVPGVFAAGDVRSLSARQAISAAGDGATAAIAAERYLDERYGPPEQAR